MIMAVVQPIAPFVIPGTAAKLGVIRQSPL
jgi:hypothetical protein